MDNTIFYLIFGLLTIEIVMAIPLVIFVRLGGWPEGYYRIFKIRYFGFVVYDPDGTPIRRVKKMSEAKVKSPPNFEWNKRTFYLHNPNAERFHGRPQWRYTPDNSLPIPMFTGKVEIVLNDGAVVMKREMPNDRLDPRSIFKAYNQDVTSDLLKMGTEKKKKGPNYLLIAGVGLVSLISFFVVLYMIAHGA